jgi:UDP-N-acetyl-D-mannosaminuronic acid dehydrogenase
LGAELKQSKVCVVGLGYIGLPTAAVLVSRGYEVRGVDVNRDLVKTINAGRAHIFEPGVEALVRAAVNTGKLKAYTEPAEADVFMLCLPTPLCGDHAPDLSYVTRATRAVAPYVRAGNLVILESTSPPGTTEEVARMVHELRTDLRPGEALFAHAPERVLPGKILREVIQNDRVVGGVDSRSTEACAEFYRTFVTGNVHLTTARTAEMVKLVENASRDVAIAFANELSVLADAQGLDVWELIRLANYHPRVNILYPGPGVGGHCVAVDPWFLVHAAPQLTPLIRAAREVNSKKVDWVVTKVREQAQLFERPRIACLGLTYKPDIDDLRESPALEIACRISKLRGATVLAVEPNIAEHAQLTLYPLEKALSEADIIVILVAHREFRERLTTKLGGKIVIDTVGVAR